MFAGLTYQKIEKLLESFTYYCKAIDVAPQQNHAWKKIFELYSHSKWNRPVDEFSLKVVNELRNGLFFKFLICLVCCEKFSI